MTRSEYYEDLKALARQVRGEHGLTSPRVLRSDLRRIYKHYGIRIDLWGRFKGVNGAYFNDDLGPTVVINGKLPEDPRVFTMAHELKHHLVDSDLKVAFCDPTNQNERIEIGAEVFAAELIYPEQDLRQALNDLGARAGYCPPELIVQIKVQTKTTLSYAGLAKRAAFFGFAQSAEFQRVQWKKLEESLYGEPVYKQIRRHRRGR